MQTGYQDMGDYIEFEGTRIDKKRILELPFQAAKHAFSVLDDMRNKTQGLNQFQFRSSLVSLIPLWIILYGLIFCLGIIMNIRLIHWIMKIRNREACTSHRFLMHLFLGNSLNDLLIKDIIVLPVSFSTMTGVHWILGQGFCKSFPIIQDSCFYSSSLILLCSFFMRFQHVSHSSFHSGTRVIEYQSSIRHHYSICFLLICFGISLCAIIPHTVYIEFVDLGYYFGDAFAGSGVCFLLKNNIIDYVKYLFIIFYVVPVCLSLSYHFKTSDIIEKWSESSENTLKTKRLTIHRGSLIETSSFINSNPVNHADGACNAAKSLHHPDDGFPGSASHHMRRATTATAAESISSRHKSITSPPSSNIIHKDVPIIMTSRDGDQYIGRNHASDFPRKNRSHDSSREQLYLHSDAQHQQNYHSFDRTMDASSSEFIQSERSLRQFSENQGQRVRGRREIAAALLQQRRRQQQQQQQRQEVGDHSLKNPDTGELQSLNRIRNHNSSLRLMKAGERTCVEASATATPVIHASIGSQSHDISMRGVMTGIEYGTRLSSCSENEAADGSRRRNTINFYPAFASTYRSSEVQELAATAAAGREQKAVHVNQRSNGTTTTASLLYTSTTPVSVVANDSFCGSLVPAAGRSGGGPFVRNKSSSFIDRTTTDVRGSHHVEQQRFLRQGEEEEDGQHHRHQHVPAFSEVGGERVAVSRINHSHDKHTGIPDASGDQCMTSYRSRDPDDMIIHSNPVHDCIILPAASACIKKSPTPSRTGSGCHLHLQDGTAAADMLIDVRVDDVIQKFNNQNTGSQEKSSSKEGSENNDEDEVIDKRAYRTSLELEILLQKVMGRILLFHSLLLLPTNILRFVKHLVPTWDAELTLDIAYLMFVGMTFSTILVVPVVVFTYCMPEYEESMSRFERDEDQRRMQNHADGS